MGIHHFVGAAAVLSMVVPFSVAAAATPTTAVQELVVTPHLGPNVQIKSKTVGFSDLNVRERAGARVLLARVKSTARSLCSDPGNAYGAQDRLVCAKDAVDRAVADAAIPALTAVYADAH